MGCSGLREFGELYFKGVVDYGIPVLSIALSLLAVALVAVLSVKVSAVGTLERFLSFCGRGSLFIMFIHQFIHFRIFGNCNVWLGFVCTVTLSVGLYYLSLIHI